MSANPERRKEISNRSYRKRASHQQAYQKRKFEQQPEYYLWSSARTRAKKFGWEFDLDRSDIMIPEVCPVFKTPFTKGTEYAASIDRIDSSKGYTKDNIQIISRLANTMKSSATPEQLEYFAKWILKLDTNDVAST